MPKVNQDASNEQATSRGRDRFDWIEAERLRTVGTLDPDRQAKWAQVFTMAAVARVMAGMVGHRQRDHWRVLDAGAGIGVLAGHVIAELVSRDPPPRSIHVTAYEIDDALANGLESLLARATSEARAIGTAVTFDIRQTDFLQDIAQRVTPALGRRMAIGDDGYDVAILNPPYGKIRTTSKEREHARMIGSDVPNVYAAFLVAAVAATADGGDVIAITPRSFCNGTYFRDFRRFLLDEGWIRQMHAYDARHRAFADDSVLQETVITHFERGATREPVVMTAQEAPGAPIRARSVPAERVVRGDDSEKFIHVVPDREADEAAAFMAKMTHSLSDLGLAVSTGPVVDFRCEDLLRAAPTDATVPLLYPRHVRRGTVKWPAENGNGAASSSILARQAQERRLLIPDGHYVVIKRFTTKEEVRRVVAGWHAKSSLSGNVLGIENHLNYFHAPGKQLEQDIAVGLTVYLNSRQVDEYFRQFSGHTQVNATDLRSLGYPSKATLREIGRRADRARLADADLFAELVPAS